MLGNLPIKDTELPEEMGIFEAFLATQNREVDEKGYGSAQGLLYAGERFPPPPPGRY